MLPFQVPSFMFQVPALRRISNLKHSNLKLETNRGAESVTTSRLYTAAMLAELVGVHVSRIRNWQRRGWLVPVEQTHRLAYFDFQELTVARQLAELQRGGATPRWLAKKLAQIERSFPDVARPLAVLR